MFFSFTKKIPRGVNKLTIIAELINISNMKISIIIPLYNEEKTILTLLDKIKKIEEFNKQVIIVDDFSADNSLKLVENYKKLENLKILKHDKNLGKGAAIRTAQKYVEGDIIIIQDADLEYNPDDYSNLLKPIINHDYKVVYGSRVLNKNRYDSVNFTSTYRIFFNHALTIFSNILNRQDLTDAHTCYKIFEAKVFKNIKLEENRFGFCPEVTTKISKLNYKIYEVPISYNGRKYSEGKKIGILDGFDAIKCLIKYKYFM